MYPEEPVVVEDKFHFLFGRPVYCDLRYHLFEKKINRRLLTLFFICLSEADSLRWHF